MRGDPLKQTRNELCTLGEKLGAHRLRGTAYATVALQFAKWHERKRCQGCDQSRKIGSPTMAVLYRNKRDCVESIGLYGIVWVKRLAIVSDRYGRLGGEVLAEVTKVFINMLGVRDV